MSKRHKTVNIAVFHSFIILEQAELKYGDRNQNCSCPQGDGN